jgi:riboflavin-specific deaminase-like protein
MPFSDETDWRRVHQLRAEADAILVGVGTILADDPSLQVKPDLAAVAPEHELLRVVLDSKGRTPAKARVLEGKSPTLILHGPGVSARWKNAQSEGVAVDAAGRLDLEAVLDVLSRRGVGVLLVEGGAQVLRSFVQARLVDQWTIYQAPVLVGGQGPTIFDGKPSGLGRRLHVENIEIQGKGVLWTLRP